ncbi:redoxin family protein [Parafilimonas sp.]|uniref:redoxin family protein n=1 Tax=Parafilimonas sp. TaxID=1969739 RepID=UPI003F821B3A
MSITRFIIISFLLGMGLFAKGQNNFAALHIGENMPDYTFNAIIKQNNIQKNKLSDFKGKVIIIDFWATWCAPCLERMQELYNLYQPFKTDIIVLAISDEPIKKVKQFAQNTGYTFYFVSDSSFNNFFPHKVIPHTVIINRKGRIAAITYPEEITSSVLSNLYNDREINLKVKNDFKKSTTDGFPIDLYKFEVTKYDPEKNTSVIESNDSLEVNNFTLPSLFREVFKLPAHSWIIDSIKNRELTEYTPINLYCLKLYKLKPSEVDLYKVGQAIAGTTFPIKAREVIKERVVYILKALDTSKLKESQTSSPSKQFYGPNYEGLNQPISSLVDYLSNEKGYLEDAPVIDETGLEGKYDIKLNWAYEKPETLNKALEKYGLTLIQEKRKIKCLVLSD